MEVHANGLTHVSRAGSMQAERYSVLVKVGIEAGGPLEGSDIELVRIFERDLGFVGDGLGHGVSPPDARRSFLDEMSRAIVDLGQH
jgi:hypothetical protein